MKSACSLLVSGISLEDFLGGHIRAEMCHARMIMERLPSRKEPERFYHGFVLGLIAEQTRDDIIIS